ncbi:microfibril-associated glycoprotein 4-like [Gastrophryne carolinensis]
MEILLVFFVCHLSVIAGSSANQLPAAQHNVEVERFPLDCQEVWDRSQKTDGVYFIFPHGAQRPLPVYCDRTADGKIWTVFQKRQDGSVDFQQPWRDYVNGFGDADGEYWLGLQNIYRLAVGGDCELRVELEDGAGRRASAEYGNFSLSRHALNPDSDGYRLWVATFRDGGAGDALSAHSGHMFSTYDKDQDGDVQACAEYWGGGFWYHSEGCAGAGLNARYTPGDPMQNAFTWHNWVEYPDTLLRSQMKIRRVLR